VTRLRLPNRKPVFLTRRASYSQSAPSSFSQSPGLGFHTSRNVPVQSSTLLLLSLQEQLKAASSHMLHRGRQRGGSPKRPQIRLDRRNQRSVMVRSRIVSIEFTVTALILVRTVRLAASPYGMTTNNQSILQEAYTQVCLEVTGWQATK
jgi:hypothetical protein